MITDMHIRANMELAAAGWKGISALHSSHIRAIRTMAIATHNTCAACGESLDGEELNLCHIVGEEKHGKGIAPFNVYVGHKTCNDLDRELFDGNPFRIVEGMARPDLILESIPSRREAFAIAEAWEERAKARRAARRQASRG